MSSSCTVLLDGGEWWGQTYGGDHLHTNGPTSIKGGLQEWEQLYVKMQEVHSCGTEGSKEAHAWRHNMLTLVVSLWSSCTQPSVLNHYAILYVLKQNTKVLLTILICGYWRILYSVGCTAIGGTSPIGLLAMESVDPHGPILRRHAPWQWFSSNFSLVMYHFLGHFWRIHHASVVSWPCTSKPDSTAQLGHSLPNLGWYLQCSIYIYIRLAM